MTKLKLDALGVRSYVTAGEALRLVAGAAAAHGGLDQFRDIKTNQSLMDCPTEPVLCPP